MAGYILIAALAVGAPALKDRPESVVGEWGLVQWVYKRTIQPPEAIRGSRARIEDSRFRLNLPEWGDEPCDWKYVARASARPAEIDFDVHGRTCPGIYELEGETLRIALGSFDGPRPTHFNAEKDETIVICYTLKKVKR